MTGVEAHNDACFEYGAELAHFNKHDIYEEIKDWLNLQAERIQIPHRQVWFGLKELDIDREISVQAMPQEFVYTRRDSNRTEAYMFLADYSNWDWNQPQRARDEHPTQAKGVMHEGVGCVYLNLYTGRWSVSSCETALPILCRGNLTLIESKTDQMNENNGDLIDKCGSVDWIPWFDELTNATYCYRMARAEVSYEDANNHVCDHGSYVATIHSIYEQTFIAHRIRDGVRAEKNWIGVELELNLERLEAMNLTVEAIQNPESVNCTEKLRGALPDTHCMHNTFNPMYYYDAVERNHGSKPGTTATIFDHWARETNFSKEIGPGKCVVMTEMGWWRFEPCTSKLRPLCKKLAINEPTDKEDIIHNVIEENTMSSFIRSMTSNMDTLADFDDFFDDIMDPYSFVLGCFFGRLCFKEHVFLCI